MLKRLRKKKTAKKVWIVLAILIVPAFVLWGVGSAVKGGRESTYAGKIFGRNISSLEYQDALDAVRNQFIMQLGDDFYKNQSLLNLRGRTWERLMLIYEAKNRGIRVADREVVELIENYPFFQHNGRFDKGIYDQTLKYVFRTQPRTFEEQTRQNLMVAKVYKDITDGVSLGEEEIEKEYRKANEEVSIYYIAGFPSDFTKDIAPSKQDLQDYFSLNSLQFKVPLSFNMEYVSFPLENSDQKITRDKIKNFLLHLKNPQAFSKIAKDFNLEAKETGIFSQTDPIPGIGWSLEILNLIGKLKAGQISGPIETDKYVYILRIKERMEPHIPDFESIKDKVGEAFVKDKSQGIAKEKIEDCLKKLKADYQLALLSTGFDKAAKECGLKSDSTASFKYGSYIEHIGASENFWMIAESLKEEGFSEIITMPSGFYIIKLKSKTAVAEEKFKTERADFSKKLLGLKKDEYFSRFLAELSRKSGVPQ